MKDEKTIKEALEELARNMDLDESAVGPMRDFMAQAIFPALAAKVVIGNLHEIFDSINEQNSELLGFEMQEEDFLSAIAALIPPRIKEIKEEKEAFKNTPYVSTGNAS